MKQSGILMVLLVLLAGCGPASTLTPTADPDLPAMMVEDAEALENGDGFDPDEWPHAPEAGVLSTTSSVSGTERDVEIPYYVFLPKGYGENAEEDYPLLIYLHGAGTNTFSFSSEPVPSVPPPLLNRPEDFPFIFAHPYAPPNTGWVGIADAMDEWLAEMAHIYRVDVDRIYLMGFSMGGGGTFGLAVLDPDKYAAIVPIAGYWPFPEEYEPCDLGDLPVWMTHGEPDSVVEVEHSDAIYEDLKTCDRNVLYVRYDTAGHLDAYVYTVRDELMFEWLVEQRR